MSTSLEDHQAGRARYYGMLRGTVTRVDDPRGLHRVRINIPGIAEPDTDWAWPMTLGGGTPQRGGHVVPAVGADAFVWFHMGDPEGMAVYACGNWGIPAATGTEVPGDVRDAGASGAEQVQSLEFPDPAPAGSKPGAPVGGLRITVDERPGRRELQVLDVDASGEVQCAIVIDRENRAVLIQATTSVHVKTAALVIDALEVQINGRRVGPGPTPI